MIDKNKILEIKQYSVLLKTKNSFVRIVENINFNLYENEVFAIVGESGCGKTIASLGLTKLLPSNFFSFNGDVNYKNENLLEKSNNQLKDIRGKEIAYIFQEPFASLNPIIKIKDQIIEPYLIHVSTSQKHAVEKAKFLLDKVGITDLETRLNSYPNQLSGGLLQRVCIAMALMCDPKILIADEPTSAIDVTVQSQLVHLLLKLKEEFKMSIIFISHDIGLVSNISDRISVMYAGKFSEVSNVDDLIDHPLHPYTQNFLLAIPSMNNDRKLKPIQGIVPKPEEYSVGCHFYSRCEKKIEQCKSIEPPKKIFNQNREVYCHLYD